MNDIRISKTTTGNVGEHYVAKIGIHTAATALAAIDLNVVRLAVVEVHLIGNKLIAAENDRWRNLPHEKNVVIGDYACRILLHSQIKWQNASGIVWKSQIFHIKTN